MRKLVYTNPNGLSIELGTTAYPITSLSGLGISGLDQQTQKAPFQDGSTFIAAYLTDREIVVQGAINKPKNLIALNADKYTMLRALNPTIGQGKLTYTYDGGSKEITCTPNITFSNKDGKDPFIRWQISFTCNDPFFNSVTTSQDTIDHAPASVTTKISDSVFTRLSVCKLADSMYILFYQVNFDLLCITTTDNGATWGAPVTVKSEYNTYFNQQAIVSRDNYIIVIYNGVPDGNGRSLIYQKRSSTLGATWGAETTFSGYDCTPLGQNALIMDTSTINDTIYGYFSFYQGGYQQVGRNISNDFGATWTLETVAVNIANTNPYKFVSPIVNFLGQHLFLFTLGAVLYQKNISTQVISNPFDTAFDSQSFFYIKRANSLMLFAQTNTYATDVYESFNNGGGWAPLYIGAMDRISCGISQDADGFTTFFVNSGDFNKPWQTKKGATLETVAITGHTKAPITFIISGPVKYPKIQKYTTGEYIRVIVDLLAGEYLTINTGFNNKSVSITKPFYQTTITTSAMGLLDNGSTFFDLDVGDNVLYYTGANANEAAIVRWKERYLGV